MTLTAVIALLTEPVLFAITMGVVLLRRALARKERLPEEIALAAAWVFVVGSLVWLGVFLSGSTLLGFSKHWTWLAALHFAFAGFGSLTVTALTCRTVSKGRALKVLRTLLIAHPVAYLVTAAGISGFPYCDEWGATSYELIFVAQWGAFVLGRPNRIARGPLLHSRTESDRSRGNARARARLGLGELDPRSIGDGSLSRSRKRDWACRVRFCRFCLGAFP